MSIVKMKRKDKIILMDFGFYMFSSGWASQNSEIPASYTCLNMMIADLKKIGLEPEDTVIVGVDYHGDDYSSWRKQFSGEYKKGRTGLPAETYEQLNGALEIIKQSTDWNVIVLPHLEYDDIAAVACRYYKEKGVDVVVISSDCDLEQMWIYDHVKVFSPHSKSKRYKIKPANWNIYKVLAKKINKEAKDQVTSEIINEDDYAKRKLIMDLTELPEWVETLVNEALDNMTYHKENMLLMPFRTLRDRYDSIFNDHSKVVTYERSLEIVAKKEAKKKKVLAKKKETLVKEKLASNMI